VRIRSGLEIIHHIINEWDAEYGLDKTSERDYITTRVFGSLSYYSMSRHFECFLFAPEILLYVQHVQNAISVYVSK